ncbi:MAG: hypothetical protein JNL09_00420 [Anaerolineales bacterium]|nr:hypothetical protein [Anaerolineales bacterium]
MQSHKSVDNGRVTPVIERSTLLKIAQDTAAQKMAERPSLLSAYLTGSVAANEPLLGEATDIDLIFIDSAPPLTREVVKLADQVVLDVQYRSREEYAHPKDLRVHPWRGPEMCEPIFLRDPRHFFELAQSSARGQFHRPDHVAARARAFITLGRTALHLSPLPGAVPSAPVTLANFCQALMCTANAAMTLTGFPGAGRRLVMKLELAARKLNQPAVYDDFMTIFGGELPAAQAQLLLADWSAAYQAGQTAEDELIHPARRTVYERGFKALIDADRAAEMEWLMLYTWQAVMRHLPGNSVHAENWIAFLERLRLAAPADFRARVTEARTYLDQIDALVETWADKNGA